MQERGVGFWYPAGAQEQTLSISQGDGAVGTQVSWLLTGQVDSTDWPLTAAQQGSGSGNVNCASSASVFCCLPTPDHGYFEIEFNLANVLWGIPMGNGNTTAGLELRRGIAHLINKQSFVANNPACLSIACVPNDAPVPVCTFTAGCSNGGLPAASPCGWDTKYVEASSMNCVVGSPGGTAYNCSFSTTCPTGTVTGTTAYPWQAKIGSPDFCAAAQHFITAFAEAGISGVTTNANCELLPPKGVWPAVVTTINSHGCVFGSATANTCLMFRTTEPRLSLGLGLAQDICALFSPAWGEWTTLAGQPTFCDNTNTGTTNPACGGGSCPFLQIQSPQNDSCEFLTSTTGVPNNCWGIGTFGFGQIFPFDSTAYYEYNSLFTTKTTVTCTSADCSSNFPGSTCASTTITDSAVNYMYLCSPTYDSLSSAMEFSTCLASPSTTNPDPTSNQPTPTFANCSGATVLGGASASTCIGVLPTCTAISTGYQAEDYFGSHAFSIPVWTGFDVESRSSNWPLGTQSSPGFITALGGGYPPQANVWEWLNAYSQNPAMAGTFRQSFLTTVNSLNPFDFNTLWDSHILSMVYDGLFVQNPMCVSLVPQGIQAAIPSCSSNFYYIDWMTTGHSYLCFPNGPACTATTLGYAPPGGT